MVLMTTLIPDTSVCRCFPVGFWFTNIILIIGEGCYGLSRLTIPDLPFVHNFCIFVHSHISDQNASCFGGIRVCVLLCSCGSVYCYPVLHLADKPEITGLLIHRPNINVII